MRSPLGRVLGLGSAKEGVEHWWLQRLTAVALVPLALWFAAGIVRLAGADLAAVRDWAGRPLSATLLVLLLAATFYHAALGLQVVIEDYIHAALTRIGLVMAVRLGCAAFAAAGIIAVLGMAFGAAH